MKRKKPKPRPAPKLPRRSADELIAEGFVHLERGELAHAEALYRQVLQHEPDHHGALALLGMLALERGQVEAAMALFTRAIAIAPEVAWYHLSLGHACAALGDDQRAVAAMTTAAELDPESAVPRYDLARHHLHHGRPEAAVPVLREVLACEPSHARARYLVASLTGGHVDSAPADYVTELFDSYAPVFESHLVGTLAYKAPDQLAALVTAAGHLPARAWQVIDVGCGSGLGGAAFRGFARHLVGSDLSPKMVEIARARGVYDELAVEDLTATLRRVSAVDLIVAADVFLYVGALEAAFAAAAAALRPGGLLAFSTELCDGDGYRLLPSSRYAHSSAYIAGLAGRNGLATCAAEDIILRVDNDKPIAGQLHLLSRG